MTSDRRQNQPTTLYAAYGSNLQIFQMRRRCPDATRLESGWLVGFRLAFRHTADIEPHVQSCVPVGLWQLSRRDEQSLDAYEGVRSRLYQRAYLPVYAANGVQTALVYYRCNRNYAPPDENYLQCIFDGYEHWGFDRATVTGALVAGSQTQISLSAIN